MKGRKGFKNAGKVLKTQERFYKVVGKVFKLWERLYCKEKVGKVSISRKGYSMTISKLEMEMERKGKGKLSVPPNICSVHDKIWDNSFSSNNFDELDTIILCSCRLRPGFCDLSFLSINSDFLSLYKMAKR